MKKTPIKAVLDTNLFVSGLLADHGPTSILQDLWANGKFELVASEEILREIKRTLQKPYLHKSLFVFEGEEDEIVELIREKASIITLDLYKTDRIKDDPTDNKFLSCALEAKAISTLARKSAILSGEKVRHRQRFSPGHFYSSL